MTSLEDLYVYYCRRCDCKPNSKLAAYLRHVFETNGNVRRLDTLDLSTNYVGRKGLAPVLELARNIPSLQTLDIRNNMLEHEDLEAVMKSLCRHPSIRSIDMSGNLLHDGSLGNILHLLKFNQKITFFGVEGNDFLEDSKARIADQLAENRIFREKHDEELRLQQGEMVEGDEAATGRAAGDDSSNLHLRSLNIRAILDAELTTENSGGHFHYASWRKNPQYALYVTEAALLTISLHVRDPIETRQLGFAVMRGNALLRVVECDASNLLAESPFDFKKPRLQLRIPSPARKEETTSPYIIMPFTFSPGKTAQFTLVAEIEQEPGQYDAKGTVTLEPLESRYDWAVTTVEGEWTVASAGGSTQCPTWRENTFYNIKPRPNGRTCKKGAMCTLLIVLTKNNDEDANDEREIGFYVMRRESTCGKAPILPADDLLCVQEHVRRTTVTMRMDVPLLGLDLFIVPTTRYAQQLGSFSISIFSSSELDLTVDEAPHNWSYQCLVGAWDSARNGGCRRENPSSWVHNPSFEMIHSGGESSSSSSSETAAVPSSSALSTSNNALDLLISLEVLDKNGSDSSSAAFGGQGGEEAQILLVSTGKEMSTFACSAFSRTEAWFSIHRLPPGRYYLIPMTHRPGVHQTFRIRVFSSTTVYISNESPLVSRLRESEVQSYADQNKSRLEQEVARRNQSSCLLKENSGGNHQQDAANSAEAVQIREEAAREYLTSGQLFTDREFPRGASSLWLDPNKPNPEGPNVAAWKRATSIVPDQQVYMTLDLDVDSIIPAATLSCEWFWSAVAAVATRPDWLSRVIRGYSPEYGLAQFSFFKSGLWHTVTVDDFLAVDALDDLCYSHGASRRQDYFIPLIEKAYAKAHRCFDALHLGLTPNISVSDASRQALMDLTGSVPTTISLLHEAGRQYVKTSLWDVLVTCQHNSRIITGMLTKGSPNEQEKQYAGIFADRMYPVLEARLVEGQRLVRLRNPWNPSERVWRGKWCEGSRNWTNAIIQALDLPLDKLHYKSLWMSFDEFSYYFSEVTIVDLYEKTCWVEGGFAPGVVGGPFQQETWVNNQQFALDIAPSSKTSGGSNNASPVTVIVGLHQLDGRQSLTRQSGSTFSYDMPIGVGIIRTRDNTRRLVHLGEEDRTEVSPIISGRDIFFQLTIQDPSTEKIVLMPFSTIPNRSLQYFVSTWCHTHEPSISLIMSNTKTALEGEWRGVSAGGSPSCGTWRNNPQYLLYPSETMEVTIILRQRSDISSTTEHIGFTVLNAKEIRSVLHYKKEDVVLNVPHKNDHAVVGTVRLYGMQVRRGMPYLIIPSCLKAGDSTGFTLEVIANRKLLLKPVDPVTDWRRQIFTVSLSSSQGTAGGSRSFSSWRNNPQYLLRFPLERQGEFVISATNKDRSDGTEVGIMLLKSDAQWDNGRRRKLVLPAEDILADSGACVYHAEPPAGRTAFALERREPLILMPYTAIPHADVTLEVSVYCTADFTVEPAAEWFTEVFEGAWDAGRTAGGDRKQNRTWINNPFAALSLIRTTHITAILLQYPRGPEKPTYLKRIGKSKVYVPPPITNPESKISIGLDLVHANEPTYTSIASTSHTYNSEVIMDIVLPPCDTTPYYFVPHSFEPEQDADFKLLVFSDQPMQLAPVKKLKQLI